MQITTLGVIGAGQMGSGIAQVAAASGIDVLVNDINDECIARGIGTIEKNLKRGVEKGKLGEDEVRAITGRITAAPIIRDVAQADYVIEAAVEMEELKFSLFRELDECCPDHVILATNTSSIPIGRIASQTGRPDRIIGMHFMNPVVVMKLVEVIRGLATSDETFDVTWELSKRFGKTPAESNDYPGFIANRILMPMINEAIFCLYESVGRAEDIDTVMRLGMNHPMGPLALADLIGLETCLAIMETLYDGFKDPKYRPCPLLRKYVEAGWHGRKSGKGFYDY